MENDPKEEEEEEDAAGNCKELERKPVGGSHGWAKERAARARLQWAGKPARYATRMVNDPKEDEEE